jgi:hypothetical protein
MLQYDRQTGEHLERSDHCVFEESTRHFEGRTIANNKNFVLPGYYTAGNGNSSQTFRDNVSVPSSRSPLKMGPTGCSETSVRNHESKTSIRRTDDQVEIRIKHLLNASLRFIAKVTCSVHIVSSGARTP